MRRASRPLLMAAALAASGMKLIGFPGSGAVAIACLGGGAVSLLALRRQHPRAVPAVPADR